VRVQRLRRRHHPIFSPVALLSTLILIIGLGIGVFLTGGTAFNPGDLSALNKSGEKLGGFGSHADFHSDCSQCHAPFQGVIAERCENCHKDISQERLVGTGLHSRFEMAGQCAKCHLDHRGQDFDLVMTALTEFDHAVTRFSLNKHHQDYSEESLLCTGCHISETDFVLSADSCVDCHQAHDPDFIFTHTNAFGHDCLKCHDGIDTLANYTIEDHADKFVLTGHHAETLCENCHIDGVFDATPDQCEGCHSEPNTHAGLFGTDCGECHSAEGWIPAKLDGRLFDHTRDTRFSLIHHTKNYDQDPFTCHTCHVGNQFEFIETQCVDCHATVQADFMNNHIAQFGPACLNCHDGRGELTNFDHNQVWPLVGQHLTAECTSCHIDQVFSGTPRECVACHVEPQIHFGLFGTECDICHTAEAWAPAQLTRHAFPLDHGNTGEVPCATCHPATYVDYTCYGCHDHIQAEIEAEHREEGIVAPELFACFQCHPTGEEDEAERD